MRLFIAVELEAHVRHAAAREADALRRALAKAGDIDARWIPEENLHITLFFLGEVSDDRLEAVRSVLDAPFAMPAFDLHLAGAGAFPPSGPPRVFWFGVRDGADQLAALNADVTRRLGPLGFEPEHRTYSAHLTIARVRDPRRRGGGHAALREALASFEAAPGRSRVSGVTLFRSRLSPKGAAYDAILRVPLE